ncbi:MAG: hypothetical protein AAF202_01735 [Pseudomonadota bacterium]
MADQTHYRKCHVCGSVNEQEKEPVQKCHHCGKSLAPFFYFDDKYKVILSDMHRRPPVIIGEYLPIHGLTAYWESF